MKKAFSDRRWRSWRARTHATVGLLGLALAGCGTDYPSPLALGEAAEPVNGGTTTSLRPEVGVVSLVSDSCTATLIAPRYIISAAHCIRQDARVGDVPGSGLTFTIQFGTASAHTYNLQSIYGLGGHADFGGIGINDFAIGRLDTPVPSSIATPAVLADREPVLGSPGTPLTDFGYGCDDADNQPEFGTKRMRSFNWNSSFGMLCSGDSGGPAFAAKADGSFDPAGELLGINSGGPGGAVDNGDFIALPARIKQTIEALIRSLEGGDQQPLEVGTNRPGSDLPGMPLTATSARACRLQCSNRPDCRAFSYVGTSCYMKSAAPAPVSDSSVTSGVMRDGLEVGWDRPGTSVATLTGSTAVACRDACSQRSDCQAFSFVASNNGCYMKGYAPRVAPNAIVTSGVSLTSSPFDLPSGQNLPGMPLTGLTPDSCEAQCGANSSCVAYTFATSDQTCWLKSSTGTAVSCSTCLSGIKKSLEVGIDRPGGDLPGMPLPTPSAAACQTLCVQNNDCRAFTWLSAPQSCYLKGFASPPVANSSTTSGLRHGIEINVDRPGNDYFSVDICDQPVHLTPGNPTEECQARCERDSACKAWTMVSMMNGGAQGSPGACGGMDIYFNRCFLKNAVSPPATRRVLTAPVAGQTRAGVALAGMPIFASSATSCQTLCLNNPDCRSFNYTSTSCTLLRDNLPPTSSSGVTTGVVFDTYGIYSGRKGMYTF